MAGKETEQQDLLNVNPSIENVTVDSSLNTPKLDPSTISLIDTLGRKARANAKTTPLTAEDYSPNANKGIVVGQNTYKSLGTQQIYSGGGFLFPFVAADKIIANEEAKKQAVNEVADLYTPVKAPQLIEPDRNQQYQENYLKEQQRWYKWGEEQAEAMGKPRTYASLILQNNTEYQNWLSMANNVGTVFNKNFELATQIEANPRNYDAVVREEARKFITNSDNILADVSSEALKEYTRSSNVMRQYGNIDAVVKVLKAQIGSDTITGIEQLDKNNPDYDRFRTTTYVGKFFAPQYDEKKNLTGYAFDENNFNEYADSEYERSFGDSVKSDKFKKDFRRSLRFSLSNEITMAEKYAKLYNVQAHAYVKSIGEKEKSVNVTPNELTGDYWNRINTNGTININNHEEWQIPINIDVSGLRPGGVVTNLEQGKVEPNFNAFTGGSRLTGVIQDKNTGTAYGVISVIKEATEKPFLQDGKPIYYDDNDNPTTTVTNRPAIIKSEGEVNSYLVPYESIENYITNSKVNLEGFSKKATSKGYVSKTTEGKTTKQPETKTTTNKPKTKKLSTGRVVTLNEQTGKYE